MVSLSFLIWVHCDIVPLCALIPSELSDFVKVECKSEHDYRIPLCNPKISVLNIGFLELKSRDYQEIIILNFKILNIFH